MTDSAQKPGKTSRGEVPGVARRRELVDLAAWLFDRQGYHETSVLDLAEVAGLAKPTFYHYFRSKGEVLYEIHQVVSTPMVAGMEERLRSTRSAEELIRETVNDILRLMVTHRAHLRVFFEHHRELGPDEKEVIRAERRRYEDGLTELIRRGVESGEFLPVDEHTIALAVFGMCNWSYQWLPRDVDPAEAGRVAHTFADLVLDGVRRR